MASEPVHRTKVSHTFTEFRSLLTFEEWLAHVYMLHFHQCVHLYFSFYFF